MKTPLALILCATALSSPAVMINITVDSDGNFLESGKTTNVIAGLVCRTDYLGIVQIDQGSKNSRAANFTFLESVVENWNANFANGMPALMEPDVTSDVDWKNLADSLPPETYTTLPGYDYVVFHFGNGMLVNGGGSSGGDHGGGCGGSDASEVVHGDDCADDTDTDADHGVACGGSDATEASHGSGCAGGDGTVKGWWAAWYLGGESHTFEVPQLEGLLAYVGGFTSARYYNPVSSPASTVPAGGCTLIFLGLALLGMRVVRSVCVSI